jgi:DNA replicative helicase MCM subunit Mcm2 (Cdc46/Mcm family)
MFAVRQSVCLTLLPRPLGSDDNDVDALNLSEAERNEILAMRNTDNKYQKFVDSMCPSICGHQEVKRGILLQLFGGTSRPFDSLLTDAVAREEIRIK